MLVLIRYNQICLYQPLRRLGKVLFSQVSVCSHPEGHIFQVLLGGDTLVLARGYPTTGWQHCPGWCTPTPLCRPGQDCYTPWPGQDRVASQSGVGFPLSRTGVPPRTEQQGEYLLHGVRYVSCVHAGGLPCLAMFPCSFSSAQTTH